jgi:rhodanese-related sulfurtransferase
MKKSFFIATVLFIILILSSCSNTPEEFKLDNPGTYQKINSENAKMLQDEGKAYIIDVRTQGEYDSGHVPSAYWIPLDTIPEGFTAGFSNKDDVYIVYCRSGSRSSQAAKILLSEGYQYIYDMGGIGNWEYNIEK